ncbi:hypothetical protein M501DRAFT_935454 [Patellaria atrata CBS 101060]|uniref:Methyltransferase small domain-containing protein n=1 Tax=Patellaria atrata CBS 101060 TaxID=1346257 RepID=A0A9P4S9J2_9PEZI|nr:hypothetical protein M501DRAFT_935454 [Patellaria atrata CBS 101060]
MLPTPSTSHVSFDRVYEPAEDSFLLLDTISSASETAWLHQRFFENENLETTPAPLILEVGTGSGIVLAFVTANAQAILGRREVLTLGADINYFACQATKKTVDTTIAEIPPMSNTNLSTGKFLDVVNCDLTSPIRPNSVDVLIFNPPYVPTEELPDLDNHLKYNVPQDTLSFDQESHLLALSYAGGSLGMEVTERLLSQLPSVLSSERGIAYILLCAQNKPEEVKARIQTWGMGWRAEIAGSSGKKGGWEKLCILRIWRGG